MITVSHPQVNQYVHALLAGLQNNQLLYEFYTTLSVGRRRIDIPGIKPKVRQFPCREVARLIAQRLGQEWLTRHNSGVLCSDAVAREFDCYVANHLKSSSSTYCYEDSALETFRAAERLGYAPFLRAANPVLGDRSETAAGRSSSLSAMGANFAGNHGFAGETGTEVNGIGTGGDGDLSKSAGCSGRFRLGRLPS